MLASLLLDNRAAEIFNGGWFATIYLAPKDYHRVHVPFDGTLVRSAAVPGELFSVNAITEAGVEHFAGSVGAQLDAPRERQPLDEAVDGERLLALVLAQLGQCLHPQAQLGILQVEQGRRPQPQLRIIGSLGQGGACGQRHGVRPSQRLSWGGVPGEHHRM